MKTLLETKLEMAEQSLEELASTYKLETHDSFQFWALCTIRDQQKIIRELIEKIESL